MIRPAPGWPIGKMNSSTRYHREDMDYDRTSIPDMYNRGRDHGPAFLKQWMKVVGDHIDETVVRQIVDLGCGTGRFTQALAERFNADVIGIDPSRKMLTQALTSRRSVGVHYANGSAEAVPLQSRSVDVVFISMVFHHFNDPYVAAQECSRVLREHGRVLLRTASLEKISLYPYVPYFPSSRPLLEQRLPSLTFQREVFEAASFRTVSIGTVVQQIASGYLEYAEKLSTKSDSILASLHDTDFQKGLSALRSRATETARDVPIVEPIDFVVFEKTS